MSCLLQWKHAREKMNWNTLDGPDTSNENLYEIMDEKGLDCLDEVYEYLTKQYEKDRENE